MRRARFLVAACAVAAWFDTQIVGGQTASKGTAAISGIVIDATTKEPLPDAVVQLGSVATRDFAEILQREFTDSKGRFVFTNLRAQTDYTVSVTKPGYFEGAYGRIGLNETRRAIDLADGQWFKDANVLLSRPGSLSGRVIDERGEPVVGVFVRTLKLVRVAGRDRYAVGPISTTDDRGMYREAMLTPGRYVVMVPSVHSSAPATTPPSALLAMSDQAIAAARSAGRGIPAPPPMIDLDRTVRLTVGGYPVPPPPANGRALTYPAAYSGGSVLAQAQVVTVLSGVETGDVDVRLEPVLSVRISGTVQGPPDALSNLTLRLIADGTEELGAGGEAGTALVASDGSFVFAGVPAGNYTIEAPIATAAYTTGGSGISMFYGPQLPRPPGVTGTSTISGNISTVGAVGFTTVTIANRRSWGHTHVSTDRDVSDVLLTLKPSGTITGQLISDTDPSQPAPAPPRFVILESATGSLADGAPRPIFNRTAAPGEFGIEGVMPGQYLFRGDTPWMLKSVVVNGREHAYEPFDTRAAQDFSGVVVTLTNAIPSLAGVVRKAEGTPAPDSAVILFPSAPARWTNYGLTPTTIKAVLTSTAGSFRIRSIPAGDYFVVAVPDTQLSAWQDAGFFERASATATRVTIGWGEKKSIDLRVAEIK